MPSASLLLSVILEVVIIICGALGAFLNNPMKVGNPPRGALVGEGRALWYDRVRRLLKLVYEILICASRRVLAIERTSRTLEGDLQEVPRVMPTITYEFISDCFD